MIRARSTILSAVSAILVTISLAAPARAVDPVTNSETLTAVEQSAPAAAVVDPEPSGSGQLAADVGQGGSVTIPKDPAGAVALTNSTGQTPVRLGLPDTASHKDGVVADDGTVTYADPTGKASIAVQALPSGVRILTVIAGPESPTEFAYPITLPEGGSLTATGDGGFEILDATAQVLAHVDAPWATDAKGARVPTRFELRGAILVQRVDHRAKRSAYPVVADPRVSLGWYAYVHFNRAETKTISTGGWGATGGSAACAAAGGLIGGPAGAAAMGAACLAQLGSIVYTAGVAENSSPKKCLFLKWRPGIPVIPGTYKDSRCA